MIELYYDMKGEWRWRYVAKNGQTSASSAEAFSSKSNAKRAARKAGLALATAKILEVPRG